MKKEISLGLLTAGADAIVALKSVKQLDGSDIMGIRRTVKPLLEEIETYNETKNDKIKELGTVNGDQVTISTKSPNYKVFIDWLNNLLNSSITIDIKHQVKTEEIEKLKPCPISGDDIDILVAIGILVEPEEPKVEEAKPSTPAVEEKIEEAIVVEE